MVGDLSPNLTLTPIPQAIINFGKEALAAKDAGEKPPNIGRGVGMALGLFFLTALTSVCQHQVIFRDLLWNALWIVVQWY